MRVYARMDAGGRVRHACDVVTTLKTKGGGTKKKRDDAPLCVCVLAATCQTSNHSSDERVVATDAAGDEHEFASTGSHIR